MGSNVIIIWGGGVTSFLFRRGLVFFFRECGNKSFWGCLQLKWNNVRIFHTNLIKMYYCIFSSLTQVVCYDSSYKHLPMKSLLQYGRAFFLSSPFWNVEMIRKLRKFFEFYLEKAGKVKVFQNFKHVWTLGILWSSISAERIKFLHVDTHQGNLPGVPLIQSDCRVFLSKHCWIAGFFDYQYLWIEPNYVYLCFYAWSQFAREIGCGQFCLSSNQILRFFDHHYVQKE